MLVQNWKWKGIPLKRIPLRVSDHSFYTQLKYGGKHVCTGWGEWGRAPKPEISLAMFLFFLFCCGSGGDCLKVALSSPFAGMVARTISWPWLLLLAGLGYFQVCDFLSEVHLRLKELIVEVQQVILVTLSMVNSL